METSLAPLQTTTPSRSSNHVRNGGYGPNNWPAERLHHRHYQTIYTFFVSPKHDDATYDIVVRHAWSLVRRSWRAAAGEAGQRRVRTMRMETRCSRTIMVKHDLVA